MYWEGYMQKDMGKIYFETAGKCLSYFMIMTSGLYKYVKPNGEIYITMNDGAQFDQCRFELAQTLDYFKYNKHYNIYDELKNLYDVIDTFIKNFEYKKKFLHGNIIVLRAIEVNRLLDLAHQHNDDFVNKIKGNPMLSEWIDD